jgi:hypothetical protein
VRKHEVLYDWPTTYIDRIADSDAAEAFAGALAPEEGDAFVTLSEAIRGLGADLARAKADRVHFANWPELSIRLNEFSARFPAAPNLSPKQARLFALLADKLAQSGTPFDGVDIAHDLFEIQTLQEPLPVAWFARENMQSFPDSLIVFCSADMTELERSLQASLMSPNLIFHALAAVAAIPQLQDQCSVVVRRAPAIEPEAVQGFARLMVLASGKAVHVTRNYANPPRVVDLDAMRAGAPYHQLNEVFYVLSEYNSRQEVLTKYLTLYHVIENFMFKLPVVDLERRNAGRMFSIRDFQRLYREVDQYESVVLRRFFEETFGMIAIPGTTFAQRIVNRWNALVPGIAAGDLEGALHTLGITRSASRPIRFVDFTVGRAAEYFAKMVYTIRNAIVHNRETELHLSYVNLVGHQAHLIEAFLIPSLEELCFALVGAPNAHVWYQNREMALF